MLLWEGGVLVALLLGGGVALAGPPSGERRHSAWIEEFFAAFTHDANGGWPACGTGRALRGDLSDAPDSAGRLLRTPCGCGAAVGELALSGESAIRAPAARNAAD